MIFCPTGNRRFWGSGRPREAGKPSKKVGAKPPSFVGVSPAAQARLDHTHTQRSMGQLTHRAGLRPEALQSGEPVTGPVARAGRAVTCWSLRPQRMGEVNKRLKPSPVSLPSARATRQWHLIVFVGRLS